MISKINFDAIEISKLVIIKNGMKNQITILNILKYFCNKVLFMYFKYLKAFLNCELLNLVN